MQVTETLSEGLLRGFTVVVPSGDIEGKRTAKLTEISRTLKIPGFRPGKVPMTIIRQRFGTAVMAEVLQDSVDQATQQVMSDRGLRPASQPKVDVVSLPESAEATTDLEFKVEVELLPEITAPDFAAMTLTRLKAEPAPELIDKTLSDIAGRQRAFALVEEVRPATREDTVTIDFLGTIDGTPFPGGAGKDVDLEVGGTGFIPGFAEQIEGMSAGDERTIDVTFPEDYGSKNLAGKHAQFAITAKALKKAIIPVVDDTFAEGMGFDNLAALREAIVRQMQREYDQMSRMRLKRELLDVLSKEALFEVPPSMVEREFAQIWQRIEADMKSGQGDDEDRGKDEATLRAEYHAIAERRVRLGLLLAETGRAQGVTVSSEEMSRAMMAEASRYKGQEQQVLEFFRKNPEAAEGMRGPIFEDKVVDYIIDSAQVTDRVVTVEELSAEPETASGSESTTQSSIASVEVPEATA